MDKPTPKAREPQKGRKQACSYCKSLVRAGTLAEGLQWGHKVHKCERKKEDQRRARGA